MNNEQNKHVCFLCHKECQRHEYFICHNCSLTIGDEIWPCYRCSIVEPLGIDSEYCDVCSSEGCLNE